MSYISISPLMRPILCPRYSPTPSNCQSILTESNFDTSRIQELSSNLYISLECFPSFLIFTWRMIYFSMVVDYDGCTLNIFTFNGHDYMIRLLFQSSIMNQRQFLHDGHDILLLLLQLIFVTTIRVVFLIPQLLINNNLGFQYSKIFSLFQHFKNCSSISSISLSVFCSRIYYIDRVYIIYIEYIPGSHLENRDFLSKTGMIMSLLRLLTPGACVGDQLILVPNDSFMVDFLRGASKGCSTS